MQKLINILPAKGDFIVIGGLAEFIHGFKNDFGDVDLAVKDIYYFNKYIGFKELVLDKKNIFDKECNKRAVCFHKGRKIDLFELKNETTFLRINGFKVQDFKGILKHNKKIINIATGKYYDKANAIINKLERK